MSKLTRYNSQQHVESAVAPLGRSEQRRHLQARSRLELDAAHRDREIQLEAEVAHSKVRAVSDVGSAAMTAQALISARENLLVTAEPSAVHGIAFISQKLTLALGEVVDQAVRDIR